MNKIVLSPWEMIMIFWGHGLLASLFKFGVVKDRS